MIWCVYILRNDFIASVFRSLANNNIKALPRDLFLDLDSLIELCVTSPNRITLHRYFFHGFFFWLSFVILRWKICSSPAGTFEAMPLSVTAVPSGWWRGWRAPTPQCPMSCVPHQRKWRTNASMTWPVCTMNAPQRVMSMGADLLFVWNVTLTFFFNLLFCFVLFFCRLCPPSDCGVWIPVHRHV